MTLSAFFEIGLSLAIQSSVMIALTALLTRLAKTDRERNRLWVTCHLLLLAMTFFAVALPHIRLWNPPAVNGFDTLRLIALESQAGRVVMILWGVGAGVALLRLIVGSVQVACILRGSVPIEAGQLPEGYERRIDNSTPIQFLTNPELSSPFCWQIHRPVIVLPTSVLAFPDDELRLVIRHEVEHLQKGHPLQLFVQRLVEIVFWFHPAVWWASIQAVACRELACDEAVVSSRQETVVYLQSLLRLAGACDSPLQTAGAGVAFGGQKSLVAKRAERLGNRNDLLAAEAGSGSRKLPFFLTLTTGFVMLIWIPTNVTASRRSHFSPWPTWTANTLDQVGLRVRDFEVDGHRFRPHEKSELKQKATSRKATPQKGTPRTPVPKL